MSENPLNRTGGRRLYLRHDELRVFMFFEKGRYFQLWDQFATCKFQLYLIPKQWAYRSRRMLYTPPQMIGAIDILCRYAPTLTPNSRGSIPRWDEFITCYRGLKLKNEFEGDLPPAQQHYGIGINETWEFTDNLPDGLKKRIETINSYSSEAHDLSGLCSVGWFTNVWIPIDENLLSSTRGRIFNVLVHVGMGRRDALNDEQDVEEMWDVMMDRRELDEFIEERRGLETLYSLEWIMVMHQYSREEWPDLGYERLWIVNNDADYARVAKLDMNVNLGTRIKKLKVWDSCVLM